MNNIAIIKTNKYYYPKKPSFRPSKRYPEYLFNEISKNNNHVYDMIREGFFRLNSE